MIEYRMEWHAALCRKHYLSCRHLMFGWILHGSPLLKARKNRLLQLLWSDTCIYIYIVLTMGRQQRTHKHRCSFSNFSVYSCETWEIRYEYPIFRKYRGLCHSAYFKRLLRCLCFNLGIDHLIGVRSVSLLGIVRDNLENSISAVSRSVGNLVWYCLELYWAPTIYGNIDDDTVQWLLVTPHRQSYLALWNKPGGVFLLFIIILRRCVIV